MDDPRFMFATGVENSNPTVDGRIARDERQVPAGADNPPSDPPPAQP